MGLQWIQATSGSIKTILKKTKQTVQAYPRASTYLILPRTMRQLLHWHVALHFALLWCEEGSFLPKSSRTHLFYLPTLLPQLPPLSQFHRIKELPPGSRLGLGLREGRGGFLQTSKTFSLSAIRPFHFLIICVCFWFYSKTFLCIHNWANWLARVWRAFLTKSFLAFNFHSDTCNSFF